MATVHERVSEWRSLQEAQFAVEDPEAIAGREAEQFLRRLIETNLKYKGAYCYLGKRVPSKSMRRRFEVDLMVLTKKHLHFLEVKNWSGEVFEDGDHWVQVRRSGERLEHPNLVAHNSKKQQAVVEYLQTLGVTLDASYFSQKIIFMNSRLRITPAVASNPYVITASRLAGYLASQRGASYAERFVHSVIELCLDSENSGVVLDGLFHAMRGSDFETVRAALSKLETWDKLVLHGGKVLPGDCPRIATSSETIDTKYLPSGTQCRLVWKRSKTFGLLQSLLTHYPLGCLRLPDRRLPINTTDSLKFHVVGDETPKEILLRDVDMIVRG